METDFLTVTTTDASLGRRLFDLVLTPSTPPPAYRTMLGAEGYQAGKIFVGHWPERKRWLVSATGSGARAPWEILLAIPSTEELSVARVDLQSTLFVPDADALIRTVEPNPRYTGLRIHPTSGRGHTLYVGAAKSDRRLRIYNKSAELREDLGIGELVRIELQLRNSYADAALASARVNGAPGFYSWWREAVISMASELDLILPRADVAHVKVEEERAKDYKAWFERSVLPALEKARLYPEWEEIKHMLLFSLGRE